MLSSKNELKLIHIGGSFCSASISISVSAGSQILFIVLSKSFKRFRLRKYEKKCQKIFEKMKFFPLPFVLEFYEGELFS